MFTISLFECSWARQSGPKSLRRSGQMGPLRAGHGLRLPLKSREMLGTHCSCSFLCALRARAVRPRLVSCRPGVRCVSLLLRYYNCGHWSAILLQCRSGQACGGSCQCACAAQRYQGASAQPHPWQKRMSPKHQHSLRHLLLLSSWKERQDLQGQHVNSFQGCFHTATRTLPSKVLEYHS